MASATSYPHILKIDDQPARLDRMPRVRIAQIAMDYLAHGWSAEEMCRQHPYLTIAEAHAALLYDWDHQAEIDREILVEWEQAKRDKLQAEPSPFWLRMQVRGGN